MDIKLAFGYQISEVYREKLRTFSDNILAQGFTENRPPSIFFPGMNREIFDGIEKLRRGCEPKIIAI